jgi:hypothetical protein
VGGVNSLPKALDVADVLLLDRRLPLGVHKHLTTEPRIVNWLIAEQTREYVVTEHLKWPCHSNLIG